MKLNEVADYGLENGVAVITVDSPPVNALSAAVRQGIAAGIERALAEPEAGAVVLICGGRTFFAGADITEFGKPPVPPSLRELQAIVEDASKPVVAAIHGSALGGGLELALVAHARIAVPSARLGLPEVKLGLLPGAGGTQRLPRIVGVEKALEMMALGEPVSASAAFDMGLLDRLAGEGNLRAEAVVLARELGATETLTKVRDRADRLPSEPGVFEAFRTANAKRFRGFKAPEAIVQAVEAAVELPFEEGLVRERALFDDLLRDSQSAAQRHLFFAERQAGKLDGAPSPTLPVKRVGVIGAGTMGGGIAMSVLNAGLPVRLMETSRAALYRGLATIRRNYEASAKKGRLTQDAVEARMARIAPTLDMADLSDCDLVIEAVFEQVDVKRDVFARLDAVAKPGAILATNTSYLHVDDIAGVTGRPAHVVGLHFFSPANVMRLLEVVRAPRTDPQVLATAISFARTLGKLPVVTGDAFGFIGNRILFARQREADRLILESASPRAVDQVLYDFGFPMGHFAMRDLVGLDVGWDRAKTASATVREVLNEMGRHGQKSGGGFYDYDEARNATPSPVAEKVIRDFAGKTGVSVRDVSEAEISDRLLYAMVNEGAKILDEGVAARASDIDVVWVTGYGWPAYRGGPMFWADLQGLPIVLAKLKALQAVHGEDFRPAPLIERLAAEGGRFNP